MNGKMNRKRNKAKERRKKEAKLGKSKNPGMNGFERGEWT